jgi:hypothetical protein
MFHVHSIRLKPAADSPLRVAQPTGDPVEVFTMIVHLAL